MVVVYDCYLHCGIVLMVIVTGNDVAQNGEQCLGTHCPIYGQLLPRARTMDTFIAENRILL